MPPLPPTINDATLHPLSRAPSSFPPPAVPTPRAEPTGPSTQRGGGCFCNLATLPIFSIHTTSYSRYFVSRLSLSDPPSTIPPACLIEASLFIPFSLSIPRLLPFLLLGDINNAIAQAPNFRGDRWFEQRLISVVDKGTLQALCLRDRLLPT